MQRIRLLKYFKGRCWSSNSAQALQQRPLSSGEAWNGQPSMPLSAPCGGMTAHGANSPFFRCGSKHQSFIFFFRAFHCLSHVLPLDSPWKLAQPAGVRRCSHSATRTTVDRSKVPDTYVLVHITAAMASITTVKKMNVVVPALQEQRAQRAAPHPRMHQLPQQRPARRAVASIRSRCRRRVSPSMCQRSR